MKYNSVFLCVTCEKYLYFYVFDLKNPLYMKRYFSLSATDCRIAGTTGRAGKAFFHPYDEDTVHPETMHQPYKGRT